MTEWQPFYEPLPCTLMRTVGIAAVAGGAFAVSRGRLSQYLVSRSEARKSPIHVTNSPDAVVRTVG